MNMVTLAAEPMTFLDGHPVLANVVRLALIFTGFTLALIAAKGGVRALREREWEQAFGSLAFTFLAITPGLSGIYRFDEPLVLGTTTTYAVGLIAGTIATAYRVTLRWGWWTRAKRRHLPGHRER